MVRFIRPVDYRDTLLGEVMGYSGLAWPPGPSDYNYALRRAEPNPVGVVVLMDGDIANAHVLMEPHRPAPAFLRPQWRTERIPIPIQRGTNPELIRAEVCDAQIIEQSDVLPSGTSSPQVRKAPRSPARRAGTDEYADTRESRRAATPHDARNRAGLRCLFPKPGVKRTVHFGDFKGQLIAQLAHPERLRETHRLPCCVQLYEVTFPQPRAAVARRVLGASADPRQLLTLTETVAQRLQLPPPTHPARHDLAEPCDESSVLAAGERIVQLRVLHDHTQDSCGVRESGEKVDAGATSVPEWMKRQPGKTAQHPERALHDSPLALSGDIAPRKCAIPERFLKPWEFRLTREEALFDTAVAASSARGVIALLRRVLRVFARRKEFHRWHALLEGHDLDEQLWSVRPPSGALADPGVREWASRTLALAGYETNKVLREWELYWRRKGV